MDQSNPNSVNQISPPPVQQVLHPMSPTNPRNQAKFVAPKPQPDPNFLHSISLPYLSLPIPSNAVNANIISMSPTFPKMFEDSRWRPLF